MPIETYARRQLVYSLRDEPKLLEIHEVAALLNVHERTVRRWLNKGDLAGVRKDGKSYLVPKSALIDYMCGLEPADEA